ncbi:MAG: glycogen synthase GlgA [Candidatus Omnitrophica bacterium]|nr:glycogen synthase GlgA [Candidatus Omnitrophota bacterium]
MKIVFFSSEVFPFAKTGGMADVCGALPLAYEQLGNAVVVFLPYYKCVELDHKNVQEVSPGVYLTWMGEYIRVFFIKNDELFGREGLYGDPSGDYADNLERFQCFCQKSLEVLKQQEIKADILHSHDWQTALIPVYVKYALQEDPFYKEMKTVISLHNLAYQGLFPEEEFAKLNLSQDVFDDAGFEFFGKMSLLKAGIVTSDLVTTVSPTYAKEIQTKEQGCGLDDVLRAREESMIGILNGLDYSIWNPKADSLLASKYSKEGLEGKRKNKHALQKMAKLAIKPEVPVFGFVGRLSHQKGIDLIEEAMEDIIAQDIQFVFLGVGEEKYELLLKELAARYPDKISVNIAFDEKMAHQIYAGSDFFLMPSQYEPCGLSQMISLRYGTIPVVHRTGGLADTVTPFDQDGNGFVFDEYTKDAFVSVVSGAVDFYQGRSAFAALVEKAFTYDFSWKESAKQYLGLYHQCFL